MKGRTNAEYHDCTCNYDAKAKLKTAVSNLMDKQVEQAFEREKWQDQRRLDFAHRAHDQRNKFIDDMQLAALNSSSLALRNAILVNGASVIALLSVVDKMVDQGSKQNVAGGLVWFAIGVFLASLGLLLTYVANYSCTSASSCMEYNYIGEGEYPFVKPTPGQKTWKTLESLSAWLAFILCTASLCVCFLRGVMIASRGLLH